LVARRVRPSRPRAHSLWGTLVRALCAGALDPVWCHALCYVVGDLDDAATFVDRALFLNPNLAGAWYARGWVRVHRGEPEIAIEHFVRAICLSPLDPQMIAMQAGTHGSARGRGSFA
jgi:tetratricopeptide (TPR) repeat protein